MKTLTHAFSHFKDFSCDSAGKESACNAGDLGSIPCLGRFLGEGKGYPLQYSGLENSLLPVAYQAPPSMEFSRQEYWSGLPFPSPGDIPTQGLNLGFPHCGQTL